MSLSLTLFVLSGKAFPADALPNQSTGKQRLANFNNLLGQAMNLAFSLLGTSAFFAFMFCLPATEKSNNKESGVIRLAGVGAIAGTALDNSGTTQKLIPVEGTTSDEIPVGRNFYNNMLGGVSAITWTGKGNTYWMLPDRGPLDGAVDWTCRLQKVRLTVAAKPNQPIAIEVLETIVLKNRDGLPFTGLASAYEATSDHAQRLDPEGIRVGKKGNLFISDEYGPRLIEFTTAGNFVRELELPGRYLIDNPNVSKPTENPNNVSGRQTNRGMEGLAIGDGGELVGLMQSPLLQDSYRKTNLDKPAGLNCRMPVFDVSGNCEREFLYQLDHPGNKLNEVLNCGDGQFIVIERDGEVGVEAGFKKLILVSTKNATDIQSHKQLPHFRSPEGVVPVRKRVLIDLLDEQWGLAGDKMPEKIEGLAFGPDLDAEHRLLLVASDNDFVPEQETLIYAFVVPRSLLESDRLVSTKR